MYLFLISRTVSAKWAAPPSGRSVSLKKKLHSFHIYNDNLNDTVQENRNIWVSFRLSQKPI